MTNNKQLRHDKADEIAAQLVAEIVKSIQSDDGAFNLYELIAEDGTSDVTALFEGILMTSAYLYKTLIETDADLLDVVQMFNKIAVARIVDEKTM